MNTTKQMNENRNQTQICKQITLKPFRSQNLTNPQRKSQVFIEDQINKQRGKKIAKPESDFSGWSFESRVLGENQLDLKQNEAKKIR